MPPQAPDSARRLAQLVGIDPASYVKQVKAAGPKAFVQAIVFRKDEVPPGVTSAYTHIKGVDAIAGTLPLGITKEFAAPILGTVGPVTAEMIKDNPGVYRVGDLAGHLRARGAVRRAAARHARRPGGLGGGRRHADQAVRDQAGARHGRST